MAMIIEITIMFRNKHIMIIVRAMIAYSNKSWVSVERQAYAYLYVNSKGRWTQTNVIGYVLSG